MLEESLVSGKVIVTNFSKKYCITSTELLDSNLFDRILNLYLIHLSKNNIQIYNYVKTLNIVETLKLLIVFDSHALKTELNKTLFLEFVENFYDFWRSFERYAIIINKDTSSALQQTNFISSMENFTNLVLETYRKIEENLMGHMNNVYRQLNAGVNLGVVISRTDWVFPDEYKNLSRIDFVKKVILQPPFFVYTKQNKRTGTFNEVFKNPIENLQFDCNEWLCFPVKIGNMLSFVYFHSDFMAQGLSLSNLFQMADEHEYKNKKPDLILIFGAKNGNKEIEYPFYVDKKNDIIVGFLNHNEKIDYFGYMKKMLLTIFNIKMIERGNLPIHGAMVHIVFKNGSKKNIVLMGDSGAGKSESLEAFRQLAGEHIEYMKTIFDDMGYFKIKNGKVYASGTEIGAFIRLDDLDKEYAYKTMDRSIFINPDKTNSRIVIPISTFDIINKDYEVEYFLYANNYEDKQEIEFFDSVENAKKIFVNGARMAKGTTQEIGLTTSFFANPFGPVQRMEETNKLIDIFFDTLFKNGVKIGQIRTKLGLVGLEHSGPIGASKALFETINKS
jgi:hypothetical protein